MKSKVIYRLYHVGILAQADVVKRAESRQLSKNQTEQLVNSSISVPIVLLDLFVKTVAGMKHATCEKTHQTLYIFYGFMLCNYSIHFKHNGSSLLLRYIILFIGILVFLQ